MIDYEICKSKFDSKDYFGITNQLKNLSNEALCEVIKTSSESFILLLIKTLEITTEFQLLGRFILNLVDANYEFKSSEIPVIVLAKIERYKNEILKSDFEREYVFIFFQKILMNELEKQEAISRIINIVLKEKSIFYFVKILKRYPDEILQALLDYRNYELIFYVIKLRDLEFLEKIKIQTIERSHATKEEIKDLKVLNIDDIILKELLESEESNHLHEDYVIRSFLYTILFYKRSERNISLNVSDEMLLIFYKDYNILYKLAFYLPYDQRNKVYNYIKSKVSPSDFYKLTFKRRRVDDLQESDFYTKSQIEEISKSLLNTDKKDTPTSTYKASTLEVQLIENIDKTDRYDKKLFKHYFVIGFYQLALEVLKRLEKTDNEIMYYGAMSYYEMGEYQKTINFIDDNDRNIKNKNDKKHFWAIKFRCLVKMKKYAKAKQVLKDILSMDESYYYLKDLLE